MDIKSLIVLHIILKPMKKNRQSVSPSWYIWFWFVNQQDSLTNMFADVIGVVYRKKHCLKKDYFID